MNPDSYVAAVHSESNALASIARLSLEAEVPSCPGWSVADLVRHTGRAQWFAAHTVRTEARQPLTGPGPTPPVSDNLVDWFLSISRGLVDALQRGDPEAIVYTLWDASECRGPARFWYRQIAYETSIHRWDAAAALGTAVAITRDLAVDGLEEVLSVWLPWAARIGRQAQSVWSGERFQFECTDGGGAWRVTIASRGSVTVARATGESDVAVRGSASDLLLLVLNRISAAHAALDVVGNAALFQRWASDIRYGRAAGT